MRGIISEQEIIDNSEEIILENQPNQHTFDPQLAI